jgi:energy-coupling factor transporter ATP-binding protein EcfA2
MTPAIRVTNCTYSYHDGKEALRNVNITVEEGERVGLVGPNGAGKSTLLLHLNGILPERLPAVPSVSVFDIPLTDATVDVIRKDVGLLFQDPDDQLFCPTVFEDVAFGPQQSGIAGDELKKIVREALVKTGLEGFEQRSPHHLSGGEKQRVCLAGILACQPRVLVLDEPTSELDPRGKRALKTLLKSIPATMVITSHDLELIVELCSRVIVMDEGAVVADGPTVELLSNEELMLRHGLEKPHILQHHHPHRNPASP